MNISGSSDAAEWVTREDSECLDGRVSRLETLIRSTPEATRWTFPGGVLAKYLFEEARYCFVYGQFLATVYLGFAYIERTIAALFYGAGRSDLERANISKLLREARAIGLIDESEFLVLERIRKMRNSYAHFHKPGSKDSVEYRTYPNNLQPYDAIEQDAATVIMAALRMVTQNAL